MAHQKQMGRFIPQTSALLPLSLDTVKVFPKLTKIGHFWHVAHPREQKFWQNRVHQIQIGQNERLEE